MLSNLRYTILITLFAALHLVVQPLAASAWCQVKSDAGSGCCCVTEGEPSTASACCTGSGQGDTEPASPDSEALGSGCGCVARAPIPLPQHPSDPVLLKLQGLDALQCIYESPALSSVWPSLASRAARAPTLPPRAKQKTTQVFTRAFRL